MALINRHRYVSFLRVGSKMFEFLSNLLSDRKGGTVFTCFGIWHICFIISFLALGVFSCVYLKNKDADSRKSKIELFVNFAFGLYVADFFLMPFAYGEIDVEKLPFHICTAMCVACFLSRHNRFFARYKLQLAALGFLSNLIYLVYPAGVMWYQTHPISYRVIQTLSFHGIMAVYGALVMLYESEGFEWKKCYRDLIVIVSMTLWALLGNTMYNSDLRVYNWFFLTRDPFYILPQGVAAYVMPFLNVFLFLIVELLVYLVFIKLSRSINKNLQVG